MVLTISRTFLDLADESVSTHNNRKFATWHGSDGKATDSFTFAELWNESGLVAFHLRMKWGLNKGDRVVLCYNFGLHFFASFLGCIRAGVVAVLVYPPHPPLRKSLSKMASVVNDCNAKMILCDHDVVRLRNADAINPFSDSRNFWPKLEYKTTTKLRKSRSLFGLGHVDMNHGGEVFSDTTIQPDDVAFLQYTSGSTGDPKGVVITHKSLVASIQLNLDGFDKAFRKGPGDLRGFSWLPQYHDLGLIYAVITPFVGGYEMHMMSPLTFIRKPLLWMELISQHRIHWSIGPNFAYKLTARKFREMKVSGIEHPIEGLDLSCLEHLANTSEPVHLDTKGTFEEAFGPYGLPQTWLSCGYGLAENVVAVCWIHDYVVSTPVEGRIDKFVAIGHRKNFAPKLEIKIVDPLTKEEVDDGQSGEIWISGPSVASGYHCKPKETIDTFKGILAGEKMYENQHFLRTGDLGFFEDDRLFICGRIKDMIIVNGTNYYPQEIEDATQVVSSAVRPGCIAAFSQSDHGEDGVLEVVFEVRRGQEGEVNSVIEDVRVGISKAIGLVPSRVVAIKQGTLPKTTSGKIRRRPTREGLHNKGHLDVLSEWRASSGQRDTDRLIAQVEQMDLNSIHAAGTLEEGLQSTLVLLPSQKLPAAALEVVLEIECDIGELEECFRQLNLHRIPELADAWKKAEKSTAALQAMCREIMSLVEQRLPPFVQFAHFLASQSSMENALFEVDGLEFLKSAVHTIFVMNWMTEILANDVDLAEKKFNDDILAEEDLTSGLSKASVPAQLFPFTMKKTEDALIHRFETFGWLKVRTIQSMMHRLIQILRDQAEPSAEMEHGDFVTVNILQATWVDYLSGRMDNVEAGAWLAERADPVHTEVVDGFFHQHFEHPLWTDVYKTWNLAFAARTAESRWSLATLFLPCFLRAPSSHFGVYRVISLNATLQLMTRHFLTSKLEPRFFTNKSALVLGFLNRQWVCRLGKEEDRDWMSPSLQEPPKYIQDLFEIFQSLEDMKRAGNQNSLGVLSKKLDSEPSQNHRERNFESIMLSFFGKTFDASATWDTLGLTSMTAVQLSIVLTEAFQVSVSPYCFMDHPTPPLLQKYLTESAETRRVGE